MNQSRGNDYFDWCRRRDCSPKPLRDGSGRTNRTYGDIWEVWDGRRGDVARALLSMDVRNDAVDEAQGNRNPFIDRPEPMCAVFALTVGVRTRQAQWLPAAGRC